MAGPMAIDRPGVYSVLSSRDFKGPQPENIARASRPPAQGRRTCRRIALSLWMTIRSFAVH
jgi:hypothetical protein